MLAELKRSVSRFEVIVKASIGPTTYFAYESSDIYVLETTEPETIERIKRACYQRAMLKLARIIRDAKEKGETK